MKSIWYLLALIILTTYVVDSNAEVRITGGGWSKHLSSDDATNESHDHWALQYNKIELGRFNNSHDDETWYVAYEWNWLLLDNVQGFLKSGVTYGYRGWYSDKGNRNWLPMVAPGVRYTRYKVQPELTLFGDAVNFGVSFVF